jgi:Holliday junction resolvase
MNSRSKGARGELELADQLNRLGFLTRRSVQYCGNTGDAADLVVVNFDPHVEVKRTERVRLREWLEQVEVDSKGRPWLIFHRGNRMEWLVIQTLDQWNSDSKSAQAARDEVTRRQAQFTEATHADPI